MKDIVTNFRNVIYFVLLSFCVFSVFIIGCGGDEEDEEPELSPTQQLTGSYVLELLEDGSVWLDSEIIVRFNTGDEGFGGTLTLGSGGRNVSYTIITAGEPRSEIGGTWKATSTTLTFNWDGDDETDENQGFLRKRIAADRAFSYTFDGTYLEWTQVEVNGDTLLLRWRKIE